jgi:hypothetical protein
MNRFGRSLLAGVAVSASLLIVGCGNSSLTLSFNEDGISGSIVVTSDQSAINSLKASAASEGLGGLSGATITNGSNPVGSELCSWSASTSGHSYQLAVYATNPSSVLTSAFKAEICSSSTEKEIETGLP